MTDKKSEAEKYAEIANILVGENASDRYTHQELCAYLNQVCDDSQKWIWCPCLASEVTVGQKNKENNND